MDTPRAEVRAPHADLKELHRLRLRLRDAAGDHDLQARIVYRVCRELPRLSHYVRLAKDPNYEYGLTSRDALRSSPGEIRAKLSGPVELLHLFAENRCVMEWRAPIWHAYLQAIPEWLWDTANCLLDKNLKCRLAADTIDRAFRRLGLPELGDERGLTIGRRLTAETGAPAARTTGREPAPVQDARRGVRGKPKVTRATFFPTL